MARIAGAQSGLWGYLVRPCSRLGYWRSLAKIRVRNCGRECRERQAGTTTFGIRPHGPRFRKRGLCHPAERPWERRLGATQRRPAASLEDGRWAKRAGL